MRSLLTIVLAALSAHPAPPAARTAKVTTKVIATNLHVPWGIAFLPGGDALVAERTTGKLLRIPRKGGAPRTVRTIPDVDPNAGEGGLLGLAISPRYRRDKRIYAYVTTTGDNRIVRFTLHGPVQPIRTGIGRADYHNGGRIAFGPDGKLYAGVGDAGTRENAQDLDSFNGKILRLNPDGSVPKGNPFKNAIWSYGHRNVQGLTWDAKGRLWATEFGQDTTDEVNLIRPGRNYGWPLVEGRGDRFTQPKVTWSPTSTASPSGDAIIGKRLYVAALAGRGVYRIPLDGTRAGTPKLMYTGYGRVRTVVAAPGGGLWLATSNTDGRGDPRPGDDRIVRVPG